MFESLTSVNAGATVEYTCGNYMYSPSYACNVGSEEEAQATKMGSRNGMSSTEKGKYALCRIKGSGQRTKP
jgi:hypothetical protein